MRARTISLVAAVLLLSGAASASAQPAVATLVGVWDGIITGREMSTAAGQEVQSVRLIVNEDGTWTMTSATWQASGRITSTSRSVVLEGDFISPNPGRLGLAHYYLSQWGGHGVLGGNASTRYKDLHITAGITLHKVQ